MILHGADGADIWFPDNGEGKYVSETDRARVIEAVTDGWRLTEPDGRVSDFDTQGRLIRIADRNGSSQVIGYADGKPAYAEDNFGRRISFAYNSDGHLEFLETPVGRVVYTYDQDNAVSISKPDMTQRTYEYGDPYDSHNMTRLTDENGAYARYEYDSQDRATASERIGGTDRITVSYEEGLTRKMTDSLGNTITYELEETNGIARIKSSSGSCGSCRNGAGKQLWTERTPSDGKQEPIPKGISRNMPMTEEAVC